MKKLNNVLTSPYIRYCKVFLKISILIRETYYSIPPIIATAL